MRSHTLIFVFFVFASFASFAFASSDHHALQSPGETPRRQASRRNLAPELTRPGILPPLNDMALGELIRHNRLGGDMRKARPNVAVKDVTPIFLENAEYSSGGSDATSIVTADVNGDGKLDLVVANYCETGNSGSCPGDGVIGVLLGNGDGSFQTAQSYPSGGFSAIQVVVADLNGDGRPDILALNQCGNDASCDGSSISVLLGNGDGTFQTPRTNPSRFDPASMAVGDINGDGKNDLVVVYPCQIPDDGNCSQGEVDTALGNGDGTFQSPHSFGSGGYVPQTVVLNDLNGDGVLDLLLANCGGPDCAIGTVNVVIGNGDGTFQPAQTYGSGAMLPLAIVAADVNNDGQPDLLVANFCVSPGFPCGNGGILSVLLGNGNGTFQPAQTYSSDPQGCSNAGYCPIDIAAVDVDGDGNVDILMGSDVLLGNGDGTFQTAQNFNSSDCGRGKFVLGDYNGDGKPDVGVANYFGTTICEDTGVTILLNVSTTPTATNLVSSPNPSTYGQPVTFTARVTQQGAIAPTGSITFKDADTVLGTSTLTNRHTTLTTSVLGVGYHSITASYSGDSQYQANVSRPVNQMVSSATTVTTLSGSANPVPLNQTVTYTAAISSQYGGGVTGTVTFKDRAKIIGTASVTAGQASFSISFSVVGTHLITAVYSGDASNSGGTSPALSTYVESQPVASKTVVTTSVSPALVDQPVSFTATVTSGFGAIPDGEAVFFFDGTTLIGTSDTVGGVATFTTSALSPRTHLIKATYAGDDAFRTSSGSVHEVVVTYSVVMAVTSSPSPASYGEPVTLTSKVTSTAPHAPTGTVTFRNGNAVLGTSPLNNGVATLATTKLPAGTVAITAIYNGDSLSAKNTTATNQTVHPAITSASLISSVNPSLAGQMIRFTATVSSTTTTVPGAVTFMDGTTVIGSGNLAGGQVSFRTATLASGVHRIFVVYRGTANIAASTSSPLIQNIN